MTERTSGPALERFAAICCGLPEVMRTNQDRHAKFAVRKRTFAYFLDNHHGDEIVGGVFKAGWGENEDLIRSFPARFYLPSYIGAKGWVGVRLDLSHVDWDEVNTMAVASYTLVAPRTLALRVQSNA